MLRIKIVRPDGLIEEIEVVQAEFVRFCPHCDVKFYTIDPDQTYPNKTHKQRAYERRQIIKQSKVAFPSLRVTKILVA